MPTLAAATAASELERFAVAARVVDLRADLEHAAALEAMRAGFGLPHRSIPRQIGGWQYSYTPRRSGGYRVTALRWGRDVADRWSREVTTPRHGWLLMAAAGILPREVAADSLAYRAWLMIGRTSDRPLETR